MAKVEIFDPSMCCSTGVCGTDVDPTLSRFAADIEWLATQGVVVQRATLAQEPGKFAANVAVRNALVINGTGVLPAVVVDGVLKSTGAYPAREEMAGTVEDRLAQEGQNRLEASLAAAVVAIRHQAGFGAALHAFQPPTIHRWLRHRRPGLGCGVDVRRPEVYGRTNR